MRKILVNLIIVTTLILILLITILSTTGIETNKFNRLIIEKVSKTKNLNLGLEKIKFKMNIKELSLFLETQNPKITYRNVLVPAQNIKVYVDFLSLIKSNPKIKKIGVRLDELDIKELKNLSKIIKPSNFKSLLNNKIQEGKLITEIEIFLSNQGNLKNFIAKGSVKDLKIELINNFNFSNVNLDFFADKNDILIKNISGNLKGIKITDGDIQLNLESGVKLNSNFNSKLNLDKKLSNKYSKFFQNIKLLNNLSILNADINNNITLTLDSTYKLKDYNYNISGNLEKGEFEFSNPIQNSFITEQIKSLYFTDIQLKTNLTSKKINLQGKGKYSFDNLDFLKVNFESNLSNNFLNLSANLDYQNSLSINLINYQKQKNSIANVSLSFQKNYDDIKINKLIFEEKNNLIEIDDLILKDNKFSSFKTIKVKTIENDFLIQNKKKILIKGNKFDATNLGKFLSTKEGDNKLNDLNSNIEIDFKNIKVPMSEKLEDFKLIGEIKKGQFIKISSKGDFGGNNYLDISMKKDKNTDRKYLEIYSDLTRPLLTEYKFFNGLSGGKLIFTSVMDKTSSNSKLKIEKFKVVNAPGLIKLLSLADLGGLADMAEGEGLSFDLLEIDMEKEKNILKLNEIIALGPSISVLMEGYQDENGLTSLKGTLVPAKTLNKMISKIPILGNIVIPKEVGEGLFGISFKMKGPKDKIKTTINPIRTLTPRFIQKIIDKNKKTK
ncbi:hypothetical protein OAY20_03080 [Candidatus Pelagibacter bacterium]|nr:hypothetical protein [Candidatus Pelagibacter bacterium]